MKKITVTDIINVENMKNWKGGDVITISAGTGTGKSFLVKNKLAAFANTQNKRILMLVHRIDTFNQFKNEIERDNKTHIIDVLKYQSIEATILNNNDIDTNKYDYIVSDEFHYFMSDASFNTTTDISLKTILNTPNSVKIFMSATEKDIVRYIERVKKVAIKDKYEIENTYDYINSVKFYNDTDTLKGLMQGWVETGEKALIFVHSAERAYELYKAFKKYSAFNCSNGNSTYSKYIDTDEMSNVVNNERFESQFLITTTSMDAGVNLVDLKLNNIVVDIKDTCSLIQAVGRKRVQNSDDTINLYVRNIGGREIGSIKGLLSKKKKMAEYLRKNGEEEFQKKYTRKNDMSGMVYAYKNNEGVFHVNELMYMKALLDIVECEAILKKGNNGYAEYILEKFNKKGNDVEIIEISKKENSIEEYVRNNVGKRLHKEERVDLINTIGLKDRLGRLQKSISAINGYLISNTSYTVISKKVKENGRLVTVWIISEIE